MRYTITNKEELMILQVLDYNIFFGWDMSEEYSDFRVALDTKGIDTFVDLLIVDANTAYLTFING